jgi:methionyl-tRNA synthetase
MPVMPRFATRLAAALGLDTPQEWPEQVSLVPPGTKVSLAREVFFGAQPDPGPAPSSLLPWLSDRVREALLLPEGQPVADATLVSLGTTSLQAIALQYQVLEHTGADVTVDDLLGCRTVAQLAELISAGEVPAA